MGREHRTFDVSKVSLNIDGNTITGYADDSKMTVARSTDTVEPKTGANGDILYVTSADKSGTIKFSLFGSSSSLPKLRSLAEKGKPVSVTLRNANDDGSFIIQSDEARVLRVPDWTADGSSEVTVHIPELIYN